MSAVVPSRRLLSPLEVGQQINLHEKTVRRLIAKGELPAIRPCGGNGPIRVDADELVRLRWGHLSLVEGTLRVTEAKSEEGERLVALTPSLVAVLEERYRKTAFRADSDYVFAHPERGSRLEADWYRGRFLEALTAAEIEGSIRTFHDMRHTALTNLAATGASPIAVMATAGHRSMSTTKQYVHLAGVVFRDEAGALERRLGLVPKTSTEEPETASVSQRG